MSKPIAHFDQLYPGRFLKAGQFLGKQVTLTVKAVYLDDLQGDKGTERKAVVSFVETPSELVLCKLNGTCIAAMLGKAVPDWIGKRVTFYPTADLMPMPTAKGDDRICIRVWGSPHLDRDMTVEFAPPRRKPLRITLHAVGKAPAAPEAQAAPHPDDDRGFFDADPQEVPNDAQ